MKLANGSVTAVVSPMGAGKTKTLVALYHSLTESGRKVAAFKPVADTRHDDTDKIIARDGSWCPCESVGTIFEIANKDVVQTIDVILIDEIQFFYDPNVSTIIEAMALTGIEVWVFGLDLTSDNTPFGQMGDILAHADNVVKLKSKCSKCGDDARISQYLKGKKDAEIVVGGDDEYAPVCRDCYYGNFATNLSKSEKLDKVFAQQDLKKVAAIHVQASCSEFSLDFWVTEEEMERAGYTMEDINDINSPDGLNRLMEDLNIVVVDSEEDDEVEEEDE